MWTLIVCGLVGRGLNKVKAPEMVWTAIGDMLLAFEPQECRCVLLLANLSFRHRCGHNTFTKIE